MKAEWGAIKFRGNADGVVAEIRSIGEAPRPADIVDYARANPDSELHKCFDWDVQRAAEKYWLHTARMIVCNIKIAYTDARTPDKSSSSVRWFYKNERTGGYKETSVMVQQADEYARLLEMAKSELQAFKRKYAALAELEFVFDAIDAV